MKVSELTEFDASKYLKDDITIRYYLAQAFESGDPAEIQAAIGDVAKARGMTALARESGLQREALYRALSKRGNAEFATIMKVLSAMGLHLTVAQPEAASKAKAKSKPNADAASKTAKANAKRAAVSDDPTVKKPRDAAKSTRASKESRASAATSAHA